MFYFSVHLQERPYDRVRDQPRSRGCRQLCRQSNVDPLPPLYHCLTCLQVHTLQSGWTHNPSKRTGLLILSLCPVGAHFYLWAVADILVNTKQIKVGSILKQCSHNSTLSQNNRIVIGLWLLHLGNPLGAVVRTLQCITNLIEHHRV